MSVPALAVLGVALAFLAGSLPLSVWVGWLALHTDIREYGDGNPGAFNVWRAGGPFWGVAAIIFDFAKGAMPVLAAHLWWGWTDWRLVMVALAPVAGHIWSPFLGGRGGKALAVTFGVWLGVTGWIGPTTLGIWFAVGLVIFSIEGWAVLFGQVMFVATLMVWPATLPVVWLPVAIGVMILLAWTHRHDLSARPTLRYGR